MKSASDSDLRLYVQRALLGNVTANLAGVSVEISGQSVSLDAYFFHEPAKVDMECTEDAAGELIADFPEGWWIETRFKLISTAAPNKIKWLYLRAEAREMQSDVEASAS